MVVHKGKKMKRYEDSPYIVTEDGFVYREGSKNPLKFDETEKGYRRVTFSINGITKRHSVHRLVLITHGNGNPENKPFVNHIDCNPRNNHIDNLEWCTQTENMTHCHNLGRCSNEYASEMARIKNYKKTSEKFKTLLGNTFLNVSTESTRSFISYFCPECLNKYTKRSDSKAFKGLGYLCRPCDVKLKI